MTTKIICIIYHRCKAATFKLYLMITRYLYLLSFLALIIHIYKVINFEKNFLENSKLAFNINIMYTSNSIDNYRSIKKIQLEEFNSVFLKKFLLKNSSLFNINHINAIDIVNRIEHLKSYGFINKVKISLVRIHNSKYITLKFKINPILKRIKIAKYKKLLIPTYFLIHAFDKQIGLPKNYTDIDKSMQKINLWYKFRGFDWANVELIKTKKSEEISFKIFEGVIATSKIICDQKHNLPNNVLCYINNEIKQRLGIIPGYILNMKKIELGIIELKQNKLIVNCKYTVYKNSYGLNICVKYNLFKSNQAFLFQQETIINYYQQIIKICNYYLYRNKLINKYQKKQQNDFSGHKIIKFNYFISSIIHNLKKIINFGIEPIFSKYGFKYYTYPQNKISHSFIFDIQKSRNNPHINLSFLYPNIRINNCLLGELILNIYYKYNKLHYLQSSKILIFHNNNSIYKSIKSVGFNISLRKNIYEYIYLTKQFMNQSNTFNQKDLNIYTYYKKNFFYNPTEHKTIELQKINKTIQHNLIIVKVQIKYNTLCFIEKLKSGKSFIIEFIYLIPFFLKNHYKIDEIQYTSQNLNLKYHQVYILPKIIAACYNNILIFTAQINWLIHEQNCQHIYQTNYINTFINNSYKKYYGSNYSFIHYIEYNSSLSHYLSLYMFYNLAHHANLYNRTSFSNFYQYYLFNNSSYYEINIGSGIQFNIPIKQIPTLRMEYRISNKKNNLVQLYVYSKYND